MRILLIIAAILSVNVFGSKALAASGDFEVAKACSEISRGFAQLRIVIKRLHEDQDSTANSLEIVENGYKTIKGNLVSLDWLYRVTAGQKGWEVLYENEEDGGGMISIAISLVDDLFQEARKTGQVEIASVSTIDQLLLTRSKQLIGACRADYGGA